MSYISLIKFLGTGRKGLFKDRRTPLQGPLRLLKKSRGHCNDHLVLLHRMIKHAPPNQILLSRYERATRTLVRLDGTSQTSGFPQKIFSPNHTALRSECGKSCGGGTQTRSVQCIQEVGPVILTTLTAAGDGYASNDGAMAPSPATAGATDE